MPMDYEGTLVNVPLSSLKKSDHRHPHFGPEYRPFLERMSVVFAEFCPGTPEEWEDDFRRDKTPKREMAYWKDMADLYEHFTQGKGWGLERRRELFVVLTMCLRAGPKAAIRMGLRHLARGQVKEIVAFADRVTGGVTRPIVIS